MRRGPWRRILRGAVALTVAVVVALLVSSLTIDLGPRLRALAERQGSQQLERPMHIGTLSVRLGRGQFVVEDLVIEGLTPADRPFFHAKKIVVDMPWWTIFGRDLVIRSVDITDWRMVVETFPLGRHNFPKLTRTKEPGARKLFTTTVQIVRARRGEFTFEDHGTPWSTVARNLDVTVRKGLEYGGEASFSKGTVRIQSYEPMRADMKTDFVIRGSLVHLNHIDLVTDGARSSITGDVDIGHWPEQTYQVQSRVHFPRMREIFFAREKFSLSGDGDFRGVFHLYKGGRELKGEFTSAVAGVNAYRFPELRGSLRWLPDRFQVFDASSAFYGGQTRFTYSMKPLGKSVRPTARLDATYTNVDLLQFSDFLELQGIRISGRASGHNLLEWPLGRWREHRGKGDVIVQPSAGTRVLGRIVPSGLASEEAELGPEIGPFAPHPPLGHVPIGGELHYAYDRDQIVLTSSRIATPKTYVEFEGRTAYGDRSRIPFHVTSADWQESDRILAGILTAFGSPTSAVPVGGSGEFDGVMLNAFNKPRIEGTFRGERLRAWHVVWGSGRGRVVIENGYAHVTDGVIDEGPSRIRADGRFSLGYPRRDRGEEIDARVIVEKRPVADLRHAFELDDYPIDGLLSGEFHIFGKYQQPLGFGRATLESGVAYGEPFQVATAGLRFEGPGVRFDGLEISKAGGTLTGAAYTSWDGDYSFNADGRRIPMETIAAVAYPQAPLSGMLQFSANGSGNFDAPRYDVRASIADLFIADEGVGQVTGKISVRNEVLTLEIEAASPRLAVSGSGRIALTPEADAELSFRFTDTSLDPYVRAFVPQLSPFTTAVASGGLRIVGELADIDHVQADGTVDQVIMSLFDYKVRNEGPIQLALDRHTVRLHRMRLTGEGTELDLSGEVGLHDQRIALRATGDANLAVLQGFVRDVRSSGAMELVADISGGLRAPVISGVASMTDGRLRHFSLPHSLEAINGRVSFDGAGVRLDDVVARMGGGDVRLGGRIGLRGYVPGELSLTAVGQDMHLRYPEGVRSIVDADLSLRGDVNRPTLTGTVTVKDAVWSKRIETGGTELFGLTGSRAPAVPSGQATIPLAFDIRLIAPSSFRIENNAARIVSSAELTLRGTYDRPQLFGHATIERGEVLFEGNRYLVTRGSIDFANPAKIEPFFDVEAETRARAAGQTYRITFRATGTPDRFVPELMSDPPLPAVDILSLLFGDPRDPRNAELRALQSPNTTEQELLQARAARLLASPISSGVGRVVEETFGVEAVQISPSLGDLSQQSSRLNPTARLTIIKRLSSRVYLTFSRGLSSSTRDQIILLEYDQSDRVAWIVSQNEDRTYALDFRVRHSF
ncbi:MAG: translocation/assembly module TamB domain-containing protein [Acidobacteria bacterium]|nr:translocation/assembly module TamB domain-containing protein [Acidobacteriota bacterium]